MVLLADMVVVSEISCGIISWRGGGPGNIVWYCFLTWWWFPKYRVVLLVDVVVVPEISCDITS